MAFFNKKTSEEKAAKPPKPVWREWVDAALFAIVAATLIRTFIFEAYTIPSGSMEGSMLINDYLFVSKLSYGPRVPNTPLAIPLVHNTMPLFGGKSYTDAVQWDYHRMWGFGSVERNDVVVFNFPAGDTAMVDRPADDYYRELREAFGGDREALKGAHQLVYRPVDKKENYIKRCVGIPGDKIEVKDAIVWVNDQPSVRFPHQKKTYKVSGTSLSISQYLIDNDIESVERNYYLLENKQYDEMKAMAGCVVEPAIAPKGQVREISVFPFDTVNFKFNRDNFGPIMIPKGGTSVTLTPQNIALYRRIIANYEHNKLEEKDGKIFINGKESNSYTFKMDYYWMMGDNRDNSLDSRYWGFVPVDHVVGKAWFVWFSYSKDGILKGLRWNRLFRSVHSLEK